MRVDIAVVPMRNNEDEVKLLTKHSAASSMKPSWNLC